MNSTCAPIRRPLFVCQIFAIKTVAFTQHGLCAQKRSYRQDAHYIYYRKRPWIALAKASAIQGIDEAQKRYRRQAGIEGTIAQGVKSCGLRRFRYIGQAKTHLQNMATGAAMNIDRLFNWFQGVLLAKTRVPQFKALEPT